MTSEISKRGWRQVLSSAALAVAGGTVVASLLFVSDGAISAEDKYKVQVRGGLAFSEFRGFEDWATVAVSQSGDLIEVILANPVMIKAYRAGVPRERQAFPRRLKDGEDSLERQKERGGAQSDDRAGHPARHRFHGAGQQAIFEERQLGIRPVQL